MRDDLKVLYAIFVSEPSLSRNNAAMHLVDVMEVVSAYRTVNQLPVKLLWKTKGLVVLFGELRCFILHSSIY